MMFVFLGWNLNFFEEMGVVILVFEFYTFLVELIIISILALFVDKSRVPLLREREVIAIDKWFICDKQSRGILRYNMRLNLRITKNSKLNIPTIENVDLRDK